MQKIMEKDGLRWKRIALYHSIIKDYKNKLTLCIFYWNKEYKHNLTKLKKKLPHWLIKLVNKDKQALYETKKAKENK